MDNILESIFNTKRGIDIYNASERAISQHGMEKHIKSGVLVGFSGGPDSVMLLLFLLQHRNKNNLDYPILAVHINHSIRGDEADRDEEFSKKFAERFGVEFLSVKIDVPRLSLELGIGVEETARKARYSEFEKIINGRKDISTIATAHNSTDNVETILFNIARGCGLNGICGIAPVRNNIIRPLIYSAKNDILKCLEECDIEYVFDSTNDSLEYTRNYIRHTFLPEFQKLNPKFEYSFASLADSARESLRFIDNSLKDVLVSVRDSGFIEVTMLKELDYAPLGRFISVWASENGVDIERKHILEISDRIKRGDNNYKLSLPGGYLVCESGRARIVDGLVSTFDNSFCQPLKFGVNQLCGYAAEFELGENITKSSSNVYKISIHASLSSAIIVGSLYVRFRKIGDEYRYGGMTHKIKKVFNDKKIPPSIRDRIPIVCDEAGILWIPGLPPRDDGAKSQNNLQISFRLSDDFCGEKVYPASNIILY